MAVGLPRVIPDDLSNATYWCRSWGLTLAQLRIAVGRVGDQPERVFADITGRAEGRETSKTVEAASTTDLEALPQPTLPAWMTAARASLENKYLDY